MTRTSSPDSTPSWIVTPNASLQINSVALSADANCRVLGTSNEFGSGQFAVYCYDGAGNLRWSNPVGAAASTQGVFWVAASGDGRFAAAGGETSTTAGFLTVYSVDDGQQLLSATPASRINQVALSRDGRLLLAVFGDTVQLYNYTDGAFVLASQQSFAGGDCNSCALSPDGARAIVSSTIYSDSGGAATGQVICLDVIDRQLVVAGAWDSAVGVMRAAIAPTGNYWGASLHDGSCVLFDRDHVTTPVWQYRPDVPNLDVAYGFDITETDDGRVVLACGANLYVASPTPVPAPPGGYLYVVESVWQDQARVARLLWSNTLMYAANPGVSLDRDARHVTATDGKPSDETPGHISESAGNFYLFEVASGAQLWRYATPVMNWPMAISPDGKHVIGGSDDGSVYCWGPDAAR